MLDPDPEQIVWDQDPGKVQDPDSQHCIDARCCCPVCADASQLLVLVTDGNLSKEADVAKGFAREPGQRGAEWNQSVEAVRLGDFLYGEADGDQKDRGELSENIPIPRGFPVYDF